MAQTPQERELEELRKAEEAAGREVPEDLGRGEEEETEEEAAETEEEAPDEAAAGEEEETEAAAEEEEQAAAGEGEEEEDDTAPGDPKVAIREKNRQIAEFKKERKEYETKLQEMQTRYEQRLEQMLEMHAGKKTGEGEGAAKEQFDPSKLDWENDPIGSLERSQTHNREVTERLAEQQQQIAMHNQLQQFSHDVNNAGSRAYGENWDAATVHLKQVIFDTVREQGGSEADAAAEANRQVSQIALGAAQNRRTPHEVLYKTAERFGFKPPEAAASNGNGKPPAKDKEKKSPSQLEQIRRAKKAAEGSGGSGGGRQAPSGIPTPQEVFAMSPEEFAAFNSDPKKVEEYHRKHG